MRVPMKFEPTRCTADSATRYAINEVSVMRIGERDFAVATDGRSMTAVPVELEGAETHGVYPAAAFDVARRNYRGEFEEELDITDIREACTLRLGPEGVAHVGDSTFEIRSQRFPDVVGLLDNTKAKPIAARIMLDASRLLDIAHAIGAMHDGIPSAVTIEIRGDEDPIIVRRALASSAAFGCLMPIKEQEAQP